MIIADNMLANGAARQLKIIGTNKKKPTERLSSGYRINRASDDAAGLSISEKMRGQIRGLTRASQNVQDGISLIQTGEGALDEVHSMLQRIRELAVEASNDTYTDDDREAIGKEVENIKDEMTRVFNEAEFNTIQIFRARYVPDIKTVPNDYELYNLSDGTPAAGVLINHKRYSWDELGAPKTSENNGWEKKFYDDNGELIWLRLEAGKDPSEIKSANATGTAATLTDYSGFDSFEYQRDVLLRDFGTDGSDTSMEVTVDRTMNVVGKIPDYEYGKAFLTVNVNVISEYRAFYGYSCTERIGQPEFYDENGNRMYGSFQYEDYSYGIRILHLSNQSTYSSGLSGLKEYHFDMDPDYVGHGYGALSTQGREFAYTFDVDINYEENGVSKTGKARCTYLAKYVDGNYYTHRYSKDSGGNLSLYDSKGRLLDNPTLYVYTDNPNDDIVETDVRNRSYRLATSSDNNSRLYIDGGYDWVQVRSYDKCEYTYSATNLNGEELMSCVSDYFLNIGTNDENIILHDSEGNEITWDTENHKKLENVKLVSPDDNNTYISMKYNPGIREDTTTVLINPDGPATRSFESFARSPGLATDTALTVLVNPTDKILHFQAGANAGQSIDLHLPGLSNSIIGIGGARFDSSDTASATISMADMAIEKISDVRALFGAYQNRLEHAHSIDQNTAENLQNAESRIRDADMAKEAMELAKQSILEQVGQSMITQANQNTQGILKLLQ